MAKIFGHGSNLIEVLSHLRTKALRKKVWFVALTEQERLLTALVRKHVNIVKNSTLATVVARIIVKLIPAIRNAFWDRIEAIGRPMAERAAKGACSIGWEASNWTSDVNVVRWYGLMASFSSDIRRRSAGVSGYG